MRVYLEEKEVEDIIEHLENLEVPYKYLKVIHQYFLDKRDECLHLDSEVENKCHLGLVPPKDLFEER